jgi:UDP-N-acetylglucosamine transferase subunit ALG13
MISLANGKRPIVMARRHDLGEHVDDHQVELARRMEASGMVTCVDDEDDLRKALGAEAQPAGSMRGVAWLGDDLAAYLAEQLGARELASAT